MKKKNKKRVQIRLTKVHHGYYAIEERTRFLIFFHMWVHGSPTLGLPKAFSKYNIARNAILAKARQHDVIVDISIGQ